VNLHHRRPSRPGGGGPKDLSESDFQLCVLHYVGDALNKAGKKDREALAEDLKAVHRAETEAEAQEARRGCANVGEGSTPGSWPAGKPKLMPFLAF